LKDLFHSPRPNRYAYQIQDFDVFSIGLETRCPLGTKPGVEICHFRIFNDEKGGQPLTSDFSVITEKGVTTSSD
jgi:hypothetical protein